MHCNTKKSGRHDSQPLVFVMVRPKRFELLAYRFVACCSIQLSYERMLKYYVTRPCPSRENDGDRRSRTTGRR